MILCPESHKGIYEDLENSFDLKFLPGGASMNAIRAAQWALKNQEEAEGATFCTGTVGNDKNADRMTSAADYAGVRTRYFKVHEAFRNPSYSGIVSTAEEDNSSSEDSNAISEIDNPKAHLPTGTCAVLLTDEGVNRSLVTNLAAARIYTTSFLERVWPQVQQAKYFYAPGFFLSTENGQGLATLKMIGDHCIENNKTFITNISAPFICNVFKRELSEVMQFADIVFGNDFEFLAWGEANPDLVPEEKKKDLKFINKAIANLPQKDRRNGDEKKPRLAITTRGHLSTLVSQGDSQVFEIPVHTIPDNEFVDTNGAGDAFVAGFICGLIYNQSIVDCLECGNKVAGSIIRMNGCTFPQESLLRF